MVAPCLFLTITVIVIQRLAELAMAGRNRRLLLREGAIEYGAGHYPLFFLLHAGWLAGLAAEALLRASFSPYWYVFLGIFVAAQGLRYWSIASLGRFWNTRVLVLPGHPPLRRGPYRFVSHPNYLAVTAELASVPLIFGAQITAAAATVLNLALLLCLRIPVEKKAMESA